MLHGDVVAWMQQVRKAVQSVLEHNGSEYNSPAADENQGVLGAKLLCMGTS